MARTPWLQAASIFLLVLLCAGMAAAAEFRHEETLYADAKGNGLSGPSGVSCEEGRLVVADTGNSRLLFFESSKGRMAFTREIKLLREVVPSTVQLGRNGKVLVYDRRGKAILQFSPEGNREGSLQPEGFPPPSRMIPKSFRVDDSGDVYLLDVFGRRVLVVQETGRFKREIPFPEDFGFFTDIALDRSGRIFLLDSARSQVLVASPEADAFSPLTERMGGILGYPIMIEVDSRGLIYVVDEESSSVAVFRRDGSFMDRLFNRGRKEGLLYYPTQLCLEDQTMVIADRDNNRVQVFVERE